MREVQYKDFSLETHQKNWHLKRPNICQFELTFKCDFHCKYCYCSCYNRPEFIKEELTTAQVKTILDKLYEAGVIWLVFTGGDPLTREDFFQIYDYAKQKGFIITIFTNVYSINKKNIGYLKKFPPFVLEITLNSVKRGTFEEITGLRGSFEKSMAGLELLHKNNISFKIKTMIIKDNVEEIFGVKKFIEALGLIFSPSATINARINGDISPCSLRIRPERILEVERLLGLSPLSSEQCFSELENRENRLSQNSFQPKGRHFRDALNREKKEKNKYPFRCAAGSGDGVMVNPYGEMFFCHYLRKFSKDLRKYPVQDVFDTFAKIRDINYQTNSTCRTCSIREFCYSCPGKAYLEKDDLEAPVEWFCELAHLVAEEQNLLLNC